MSLNSSVPSRQARTSGGFLSRDMMIRGTEP